MLFNSPGFASDTVGDFLLVGIVIILFLYDDAIKMFADESICGILKRMVEKTN